MTVFSLFSGIAGGDLGMEQAGMECVGQCEIDPFCRRVLERHYPGMARFEDVREVTGAEFDGADACIFGSPCQDLSVAGRRAGLAGERSGLFFEAVRILERARPRWCVFENVPGLLSSNGGRDFLAVLDSLGQLGYGLAWAVLDAQHFGVPQRRRRVFVVGCLGEPERAIAVLSEPQGGAGHPAAGGTSGAGIAATLTRGTGVSGNAPGRRREDDVNLVAACLNSGGFRTEPGEHLVADPLTASYAKHGGASGGKDSGARNVLVARALTAPHSPRYDGDTDTFVVAQGVHANQRGEARTSSLSGSLTSQRSGKQFEGVMVAPTLRTNHRNNSNGGTEAQTLVAHALTAEGHDASEDGTGRGTPIVAFATQQTPKGFSDTTVPTLQQPSPSGGGQPHAVSVAGAVRRLTPTECERLQGFPDGWTAVDGDRTPDSPRYRALGNAMAVPVVRWIGERIVAAAGGDA